MTARLVWHYDGAVKLLPDRAILWQFLRIQIACGLGEVAGLVVGLRETHWALITALVVTRPEQRDARGKAYERTLGSVIGGTVGLGVIEADRVGLPKYPLFVVAFVALAFATARWSNMRLAAITLIVVVLVPSSQDPLVRPFDRVVEIFSARSPVGSFRPCSTSTVCAAACQKVPRQNLRIQPETRRLLSGPRLEHIENVGMHGVSYGSIRRER